MSRQVGRALCAATTRLKAAGVTSARLDARILLAEIMGWQPQALTLRPETELTTEQARRFAMAVDRRAMREPVSQIVGQRGFWTLDLHVTADTLTPRPDSETLIEAILDAYPDRSRPMTVVDLGTGTGCLILTILAEYPLARGIAVDVSAAALAVAAGNAETLGLAGRGLFVQSHWASALTSSVCDLVVCNPPYIRDSDIDVLEPEVARWEPRIALSGGADGLECYRALMPDVSHILAGDGLAVFEVGLDQAGPVSEIAAASGLCPVGTRRDLGGIERCVIARRR